jgi:MFS family permease
MVMEPLMGSFSDRLQHQVGTRFPLVSLGVIVAAGCFLAIPTGLFWGQGPLLRWLLPLIMVAWALAMTVFRSPAMSLLGRYAFATHLPQAASVLTLVGGLAGAAGPLANQFILGLGPLVAFAIGSGVLLLASVALGQFRPNATVGSQGRPGTGKPAATTPLDLSNLGLIFGAGVGIALGFRLVMTTFPTILKQNVTAIAPPLVMGLIFIALAVTAMPAGWWATRLGNHRAMLMGLALLVLLTAVMNGVSSVALSLTLAVGLGGALSLVFNGTLPFALGLVPAEKAGLGIGLYFSGGALATCLFASWLTADHLPPQGKVLLAVLAFLLAALCVGVAAKR